MLKKIGQFFLFYFCYAMFLSFFWFGLDYANENQGTVYGIAMFGSFVTVFMIMPTYANIKNTIENYKIEKSMEEAERQADIEWELRQREQEERDRLYWERKQKEDKMKFEKEFEQKRRMMEMEREINLKYSILERMQHMELSNMQMRRRVEEAERNFNNLSSAELNNLYKDLENSR